ncbi:hypothetical protein PGT21_025565 [Puccinia graminis f. sp. tritici]|uniref:RING-type domain-containing protein n=1 Tax=Puccinia graminis f. sp. tritici TaxID=56615 RepID=A0A5B0RZ69_PUCGR|nr:hypothetical protein PGT21_025565 [Puccinia graminis f. sp. tritici]KAA1131090.1 hypothetical protein PGTUg99_003085 [Puccinia graminis f. sp. tritici]
MMRFINLIVPLVLEFLIGVSASLHKPNCPNNDIIWEVESSTGTATLICTGCRQTGESFKLAPCPKSNCGGQTPIPIYVDRVCHNGNCRNKIEQGMHTVACALCFHEYVGYWLPKRNCPKCGIDPPPRRKFYDK